jgi:hypothetical protein
LRRVLGIRSQVVKPEGVAPRVCSFCGKCHTLTRLRQLIKGLFPPPLTIALEIKGRHWRASRCWGRRVTWCG